MKQLRPERWPAQGYTVSGWCNLNESKSPDLSFCISSTISIIPGGFWEFQTWKAIENQELGCLGSLAHTATGLSDFPLISFKSFRGLCGHLFSLTYLFFDHQQHFLLSNNGLRGWLRAQERPLNTLWTLEQSTHRMKGTRGAYSGSCLLGKMAAYSGWRKPGACPGTYSVVSKPGLHSRAF